MIGKFENRFRDDENLFGKYVAFAWDEHRPLGASPKRVGSLWNLC
jgi:hypothetical protein